MGVSLRFPAWGFATRADRLRERADVYLLPKLEQTSTRFRRQLLSALAHLAL